MHARRRIDALQALCRAGGLLLAAAVLLSAGGCGGSNGGVRRIEIRSEAVDRDLVYGVILPRDYDEATERRYPVVYLLHGLGGAWYQWVEAGAARGPWRDDLLLVLVDAGNSWYFNWPDAHAGDRAGPGRVVQRNRWEDYLVRELLPDVDRRFRTDPERRGVCGFSMGALGGALLVLRHPDSFREAALLAGPFETGRNLKTDLVAGRNIQIEHRERLPRQRDRRIRCPGFESQDERTPRSPLPEDPAFYDAHDPFKLAAGLGPARAPRLFIACGVKDELLPQNERFAESLRTAGVPFVYTRLPGGHDREFIVSAVPQALKFLAAHLHSAPMRAAADAPTGETYGGSNRARQ